MGEWRDDDLKILSDAVEYHGKVPNTVIDDLAERFGRTPEAVRSRIRQLKSAARKVQTVNSDSVKLTSNKVSHPRPRVKEKAKETPHYTGLIQGIEEIQTSCEAISVKESQIHRLQEEVASLKELIEGKRAELLEIYPEAQRILERY